MYCVCINYCIVYIIIVLSLYILKDICIKHAKGGNLTYAIYITLIATYIAIRKPMGGILDSQGEDSKQNQEGETSRERVWSSTGEFFCVTVYVKSISVYQSHQPIHT